MNKEASEYAKKLGKLSKGKPKKFTEDYKKQLSERLKKARAIRWKSKKKR